MAGEVVAALEPIIQAPLNQIDIILASTFDLFEQMESSFDAGRSLLEEVRDDLVAATGKSEVAEPFDALLDRVAALHTGLGHLRDRTGDERKAVQAAHAIASGGNRAAGGRILWRGRSTKGRPSYGRQDRPADPGRQSSERLRQVGRAVPGRNLPGSAKLAVIGSATGWSWTELTTYLHLPPSAFGIGVALTGALGLVASIKGWLESDEEKKARKEKRK